jgi:Suppressor of fused protein (SUFU)
VVSLGRGTERTTVGYGSVVSHPGPHADPSEVLAQVEAGLVEMLGSRPDRASVSFVGVEPIEILLFESGALITLVSLGMSRRPMTASDSVVLTQSGPRAELVLQVRGAVGDVWRQLAVLAAAPVVEGVVYSAGMTLDLGTVISSASRCTGGVVVGSAMPSIPTVAGDVGTLRVLPATPTELAWARVRGSTALTTRWDETGTDLLDLQRAAVELD